MKDFDYYNEKENERPTKKEYTTVHIYRKGKILASMQNVNFQGGHYPGAVFEFELDEEGYKKALNIYRQKRTDKFLEFKKDLFEEFDVIDNPKADLAFELAWDRHQSYEETYEAFSELVQLII